MSASLSLALAFALLCLCGFSLIEAGKGAFRKGGFSVELIHRDSSKSPFYRSTETHFQRVTSAIRRSIISAKHINLVSPSDLATKTPQTIITAKQGEYLMSYSIGTPPFQLLGILDTGSDIIWFQCQPCVNCFNQTSPLFDPSKSSTYKTIPCNADTCQAVRGSSCASDYDEACQYSIRYGDGSHSQGPLSVDTLTLGSIDRSRVLFPNTIVGCGTDNTLSFTGDTSGIVGLAGGPVSLITQMGDATKGKFSYCLVPIFSKSNVSSKLNFGDSAIVSGVGTVSTPIVSPPSDEEKIFYYLRLEGFSVGDTRVEFESPSDRLSKQGNIIIDSGTTSTILPSDIYSKLESVVAEQVKLRRVGSPVQGLSLCYQIESEQLEVPLITAHFTGADVKMNALNSFVEVAEGIVCLAFTSLNGLSIFGNLAQQNLLVGYDIENKVISFKPTDCTKA